MAEWTNLSFGCVRVVRLGSDGLGHSDVHTLRVLDTDVGETSEHFRGLDARGDHLDAHRGRFVIASRAIMPLC